MRNLCVCYSTVIVFLTFISAAFAAEPKLTFHVPFDGSINAQIAGGKSQGQYGLPTAPQFADAISGKGMLSGDSKQRVVFDAAGNISKDQWTISFWVKGLPGADWYKDTSLQTFWQLEGKDGFMWFYAYGTIDPAPLRLFSKQNGEDRVWLNAPKTDEEEWHHWAVTWRKGENSSLYLDGQLAGTSASRPPENIQRITIGQSQEPSNRTIFGENKQNKIIDEFKIYDTALSSGDIARQYLKEGNFANNPEITVSPTDQKIIIDGKIDPVEWRDAAGINGFISQDSREIARTRTWGRLTYDQQNLYIALNSDNPPEVKEDPATTIQYGIVKKDAIRHDDDVKEDDHFRLQIVPNAAVGKSYSILVNGLNTVYDATIDKTGKEDVSWQSDAQVKTVVNMDGWSLEAAIPLKSLGINSISDGSQWRMNLGRVWKLIRQDTDTWATGFSPESAVAGTGIVRFSNKDNVNVDLQQFDISPGGKITANLNVVNRSINATEMDVSLNVKGQALATQKISLDGKEQKTVSISGVAKDANGASVGLLVKNKTKVLLSQSAPIIIDASQLLNMWSYPSMHQLRLGWQLSGVSDPEKLSLNAQLKDAKGSIVRNIKLSALAGLKDPTQIDVQGLPDGKYELTAQLQQGQDVLQQQTIPFDKKPLPEWVGNSLGISDTPPAPWTNVEVDKPNDTLSVWGRDYEYAGHLFPSQIINQGKPMLAAPMQLMAQSKNGKALFSGSTKATSDQWTKVTATRADSLRHQVLGDVNVQADSYVEFDGMSWTDLTVSPVGQKVTLDKLTIEIPLKKEWAKLIKPGDNYFLDETGTLPKAGWKGKASSMPWVGNANGGIQFFQETIATWIGSKSVEVIPVDEEKVLLRVHLVDAPFELDKPLHFAFGWMASPVKAAPKNHRDWRLISPAMDQAAIKPYVEKASALNPDLQWYLPWWNGWWWLPEDFHQNPGNSPNSSGLVPVPAGPENRMTHTVRDNFGTKFYAAPYGRLTQLGTANEWFRQFGDEWVPTSTKFTPDPSPPEWSKITNVSQASSSLRDFYAWGYNKLLNEYDVHALYFDVSQVASDSNFPRGAGTKLPDGTVESIFNILGTREVFKRIYTLLKAKDPNGVLFYHTSGTIILPVNSFTDALVDGENYTGKLDRKDNRGYEKLLSLDQFRTEYAAQHNFGPATVFLPQFERSKSITPDEWKTLGYQHADYIVGLTLLHDSSLWWIYTPQDYLAKVYSAFDATGLNAKWSFIPYWEQKYFSLPEGVSASVYQSPDNQKAVVVMMNTSGKDQRIKLPLTLGKSTFTKAKAVYPDQVLKIEANAINFVEIANNNFIAVELERR